MIAGVRATARALGITHPRLLVLVAQGKAPRLSDGRFDVEQVRRALATNLDSRQKVKVKLPEMPGNGGQAQATPAPPISRPGIGQESPSEAERVRAQAEALGRQLRVPAKGGTLLDMQIREKALKISREAVRLQRDVEALVAISEVEPYIEAMNVRFRARCLAIPARLADRLANENQAAVVQDILLGEVERVLNELSAKPWLEAQ